MGFLKDLMASPAPEPDHSRAWLAHHGTLSRKLQVGWGVLNRIVRHPLAESAAIGRPIADDDLTALAMIVHAGLEQDRSLAAHVARDQALQFEAFGGLTIHADALLRGVGMPTDIGSMPARSSSLRVPAFQATVDALAMARVVARRYDEQEPEPADLAVYDQLFTTDDEHTYQRAIRIAAWSCLALGRLRSGGHLGSHADAPAFSAGHVDIPRMDAPGWYPNPVNAGDTSHGTAPVQRFWDGSDWTERWRVDRGRSWETSRSSMFVAPTN